MKFDKFYDAVSMLIQYNIDSRQYYKPYGTDAEYAKNHCTVQCSAGIKTGKSNYIIQHANKEDLIIVASENAKYKQYTGPATQVVAAKLYHLYKNTYYTIWVDEPSLVFSFIESSEIYKFAHGSQTFVLLGD